MNTTFRRQLTMIACLLLAATFLLGVSFLALFHRYVEKKQEADLRSAAGTVTELAELYPSVTAMYLDWDFRMNLSLISAASETDLLLLSADGTVLLCSSDVQGCEHIGQTVGQDKVERVFSVDSLRADAAASALYGDERLAIAMGTKTSGGQRTCIVLASVKRSQLTALTGGALRIFVLTALAVLLIALLATPGIARREAKPIKDMAAAARQLAHGNLSVRVATGHQNEEIEELAVAFNNMAAAMQNSETARQEFVANVSHELKTPITTIAGYLDGMLDGTIPEEKHRAYMELVLSEARRLSRLVRNMLEVSRLRDQGIAPEKLTDFDICDVAAQALLSFEQRINRKKLNVEVELPELGVSVHAFEDAVTQVLYNLLDNAVKFVNEGGTLGIRVHRQGGKAVIAVRNTGAVIPPEELPLIFDRFHKTDKSCSSDRDGAGLGLYIVKTMVLAHGEDVYVTSADGVTEFTFTLPLGR